MVITNGHKSHSHEAAKMWHILFVTKWFLFRDWNTTYFLSFATCRKKGERGGGGREVSDLDTTYLLSYVRTKTRIRVAFWSWCFQILRIFWSRSYKEYSTFINVNSDRGNILYNNLSYGQDEQMVTIWYSIVKKTACWPYTDHIPVHTQCWKENKRGNKKKNAPPTNPVAKYGIQMSLEHSISNNIY